MSIRWSVGALAAAGLEVDAVAGICVGMSGVDRPADVDTVREYLQVWLPVGVGSHHAWPVWSPWAVKHEPYGWRARG